MTQRAWTTIFLALAAICMAAPVKGQAIGNFVSFDPPGSDGTEPKSININGAVTGSYSEISGHGFVRDASGAITTFDPPDSVNTFPDSINSSGSITGWYLDASYNRHGFVRDSSGAITEFDVPGEQDTVAEGINSKGVVVGSYTGGAFVRYPDGSFETYSGLTALAIDDTGVFTGAVTNSPKAFVTSKSGQTRQFTGLPGTRQMAGTAINDAGTIAGYYSLNGVYSVFLLAAGGATTYVNVGDGVPIVDPIGMNAQGFVVGTYNESDKFYGFLRAPDAAIFTVLYPGSTITSPAAINDQGRIVGWYQDTSGAIHGFLAHFQG